VLACTDASRNGLTDRSGTDDDDNMVSAISFLELNRLAELSAFRDGFSCRPKRPAFSRAEAA
jgi:hypothetical protein